MDCLFCKISAGEIPSKKIYEDDRFLAFFDIAPQAPIHILVIPKEHLTSVDEINDSNKNVIADLFALIPIIAKKAGIQNGYRVISNIGENACQSVKHIHFHILGGAKLSDKMA